MSAVLLRHVNLRLWGCRLLPKACTGRGFASKPPNWDLQRILLPSKSSRFNTTVGFDVGFVDTAEGLHVEERDAMPVILGVHGAPGSHEDFTTFLEPLTDAGYRIILPNFPEFGHTFHVTESTKPFFRHSPKERAEFLENFLRELSVDKLDLIIGHSVGCLPVIEMCAKYESVADRLAFICPVHGHKPPIGARPEWLVRAINTLWNNDKAISKIMAKFLYKKYFIKRFNLLITDDQVMAATVQSAIDENYGPEIENVTQKIVEKKTPRLFVHARRDPLVDFADSMEFARMLGFGEFFEYARDGSKDKEREGPKDVFVKGLLFDAVTHYPHWNRRYGPVIMRNIERLLRDEK